MHGNERTGDHYEYGRCHLLPKRMQLHLNNIIHALALGKRGNVVTEALLPCTVSRIWLNEETSLKVGNCRD